jgi:hypothetical protein
MSVKFTPEQATTTQMGEYRCSSTLSLTSALDGVDGQGHAPDALTPGKTRYLLYRRLGRSQSRSGQVRKISPWPEFDPRIFQPVASRYADWAIQAPKYGYRGS